MVGRSASETVAFPGKCATTWRMTLSGPKPVYTTVRYRVAQSFAVQKPFMALGNVPIADGGHNRKRPFAKNAEIGETAVRYALVPFFLNFGFATEDLVN
jgi:hypothetical protein